MKEPIFIKVPWLHATAITLWFVVLYVGDLTEEIVRHESIHFRQYNELWVLGFWAIYLWDFLVAKARGNDFWAAYERIRFEQEAYAHENEPDYLANRPKYAWTTYTV